MDWKDVEKYANEKGMTIQEAAQALGISLENKLDSSVKALEQFGQKMWNGKELPDDPARFRQPIPMPERNDSTLANQQQYEQNLSQKLKNNAASEEAYQNKQNKLDESIDSSGYKNYSMGGEVKDKRFSHLKEMLSKHKKANAEIEASNDPMKFIKDNKNPSIRGKRGVAF